MNPRQLSVELRTGQSPDLNRRRWVIGLSLVGCAMGKIVGLYQTGIIKRLPDPPVPIFDSTRVDASDYAYKRMSTPDGLLMLVSYGITAALAAAGGQRRAEKTPWLPLAMSAKTVMDLALALQLTREEWEENEALCFYCQVATVASLASVALAAPEALSALQQILGHAPDHDARAQLPQVSDDFETGAYETRGAQFAMVNR